MEKPNSATVLTARARASTAATKAASVVWVEEETAARDTVKAGP